MIFRGEGKNVKNREKSHFPTINSRLISPSLVPVQENPKKGGFWGGFPQNSLIKSGFWGIFSFLVRILDLNWP
jgi:hypothetical protein